MGFLYTNPINPDDRPKEPEQLLVVVDLNMFDAEMRKSYDSIEERMRIFQDSKDNVYSNMMLSMMKEIELSMKMIHANLRNSAVRHGHHTTF